MKLDGFSTLAATILFLGYTLQLMAQQPVASGQPAPPEISHAPAQAQPQAPSSPPAPQTTPPVPVQPGADAGQPGSYTIQRTVRLVILDMVVTDAHDTPIKDLKREEIHIQEAGELQTILNFDPAGANTPGPDVSIESTADLDRLAPRAPVNIILLDEFNTRFEDMAFARYSLKKYLERQPGKLETPTMLVAVSLTKFDVLRDYTQNKDEILSALDHHFAAYPWQAQQAQWRNERYATAFITLRRVAEAVIGHHGHKTMIWIGRGFPARPHPRNADLDEENRVNSAAQSSVNILRDARVTLYTIDPAGVLVDPGVYGEGARFNDPFGGNYQFNLLAKATGGRTLYGRNDVDAQIGTAIQDGGSYYTVTYRPSSTSNDPQKFRRILVTVDRPGLKVITRQGYYPRSDQPAAPFDAKNMSKRMVIDLLAAGDSNMNYDAVPITVKPSPTAPDTYLVHINGKSLVWSPASTTELRHTEVIVMASIFDKKDKELKRTAISARSDAPKTAAPTGPLDNPLEVAIKVDHNPKAVRARFVVRIVATNRMGTADLVLGNQASAPSLVKP